MSADFEKIAEGIGKTGFVLEYRISEILSNHGWQVINNKYYLDDQSETVREVDLVAYRASKRLGVLIYTVLVVSCKKSEKNVWTLMAKTRSESDVNIDLYPIHVWSNDKIMNHMMKYDGWKDDYVFSDTSLTLSYKPPKQIFAFQEMNETSGNPQNDKAIFNSITSLIKAQAYELSALPHRKKGDRVVYQFNLLSVTDAELIRADLSGTSVPSCGSIEDEVYVSRYIVNKEESFSRIHFINERSFDEKLKKYDNLHDWNVNHFYAIYEGFHAISLDDFGKRRLFIDDIRHALEFTVSFRCNYYDKKCRWSLHMREDVLSLMIEIGEDDIEKLNADTHLREHLAKCLKQFYRFEGNSQFEADTCPF